MKESGSHLLFGLALVACGIGNPFTGHLCLEDEALGIERGMLLNEALQRICFEGDAGGFGNFSAESRNAVVGDAGRSPYDGFNYIYCSPRYLCLFYMVCSGCNLRGCMGMQRGVAY